jgi:hypothetical protein
MNAKTQWLAPRGEYALPEDEEQRVRQPGLAIGFAQSRCVNLSHSADLVLVALTVGRMVGIDIEWTPTDMAAKGLSLPLDGFDVSLLPEEAVRLLETRPDRAEAQRWVLGELDVGDGHKAALAVEGSRAPGIGPPACARSVRIGASKPRECTRPADVAAACEQGLQHQSAVDLDDLAGDVARSVRC